MPQGKQDTFSEIRKSFRLMWDGFPHPVLLLQKKQDNCRFQSSRARLGCAVGCEMP